MHAFPRRERRRLPLLCALALLFPGISASPLWASSFVEFESGQVRPLALSPDGTRVFAVNTPDNRLEIFSVGGGTLTHAASVPVGMEPVAVAARSNGEVWVVNHLSDSVSVVDVAATPPRVIRTLLVGDEPRDIVFAGSGGNRAFVTTAHRGQNDPNDPQLTTPGVGRADVWVFDADNLGASLGGTPLAKVVLFGDTPRALAASPDGSTVYAAVFHSGNRTTTVAEGAVCNTSQTNLTNGTMQGSCSVAGVTMPGGLPLPHTNSLGEVRPETGLIVRFNGTNWVDRACRGGVNRGKFCTVDADCPSSGCGRNWNNAVKFSLPDKDVFAIDANANPPAETGFYAGVGTVLFNLAVNPVTGKVYVSNTESRNEVRFEGPGGGGSTVQGHLAEARISVLSGGTVTPRHLNKHIDYSVRPAPAGVKDNSLASPNSMAVTANGATLYVAALGSDKIGVFATAALEDGSFVPSAANHIHVSGGGPTGLLLDETNARLYVLTRFDNGIAVIDTGTKAEVDHLSLFNPEPASVVEGRRFLYDAYLTSSNGEASCASCHIFGDFDSLAWDLGNPDDATLLNPNPIRQDNPAPDQFLSFKDFHPMKGPMTTQSLRGMANHGPMHWRGDRTGGNDPGGSALDEKAAFEKFNGAFPGLLGRTAELGADQMQAFTEFILQVAYPPNPIRALDNSLTAFQQAGRDFFMKAEPSDVFQPCHGCHTLDPQAGFFGSDGFSTFEAEPQFMKVAHLRNLYQKVGMFGMPAVSFLNSGDNGSKGDQVRGFGFLHDGSTDTVFRFLNAVVFNQIQFGLSANPGGFPNNFFDISRYEVEAFMLAFDSNLAPIVGQQITVTSSNLAVAYERVSLLLARAAAGECDVVVKGVILNGIVAEQRGWVLRDGRFRSDRVAEPLLSDADLRVKAGAPGQVLTYTAVPPGSGERIGIDRDSDGVYDSDELDAGSNPTDSPRSCAGATAIDAARLRVSANRAPAGDEKFSLRGEAVLATSVDPLADGFGLRIDEASGNMLFMRNVPAGAPAAPGTAGWKVNAAGTKWTYRDPAGSVGGIKKIVIVDRSAKIPGLHTFKVKGGKGNFRIPAASVPPRVTVFFGPDPAPCLGREFNSAFGPQPACKLSSSESSLRCK